MSRRQPVYRDVVVDLPTRGLRDWPVLHARPLLRPLLAELGTGWREDPDPDGWFAWREIGGVVQEIEAEPAVPVPSSLPDPLPLRVTARVTPARTPTRLSDLLDLVRDPARHPDDDAFLDRFGAAVARCRTFSARRDG